MIECGFDIETELFDKKKNKHLFNVDFICGAVAYADEIFFAPTPHTMYAVMKPGEIRYAHNAVFDVNGLARHGINLDTTAIRDTMLMAWLLDENSYALGLNDVAIKYLGEGKSQSVKRGFVPALDEETKEYVKQDAKLTLQLGKLLASKLEEQGLTELFEKIDQPFMWLLNKATLEGCNVDQLLLDSAIGKTEAEVSGTIAKFDKPPYEININSPKQVWKVIYTTLNGIPRHADGKTPCTDTKTINSVPKNFLTEEADEILEYRKKAKYLSTFLKGAKRASSEDGLIHPLYNLCRARTGRLSSGGNDKAYPYSFNIQNVSNKDPEIREAICAKPGTKVCIIDASQLELRVLAHYSEDPELIRTFLANGDPHRTTASLLFSKPEDQVTEEERFKGKTLNFSVLYGSTEEGLEYNSGIDRKEGARLLKTFYAQYKGVTALKAWVKEELKVKGYVTSLYGRRRRFPEYPTSTPRKQEEMEKWAFSALIQGTAMDLMKECAVTAIPKLSPEYKFFLQVHDEFGFYVPEGKAVIAMDEIRHAFQEGHRPYRVPILFTGGVGGNWRVAKHGGA